jgi:acyl-CoA synthetase (AMP-forming)/AMP-acid ligase II
VRTLTYSQLHREVCKFANVMESLGLKKGDRAAIYMPMVPEAAVAMLACARIGVIHTVIFGGFSAEAIKDRVNDCQAKLIITADGGWRRGKVVELKPNVDRALSQTPSDPQRIFKAIVEHALHKGSKRPLTLYWGCRVRSDLYFHELAESWQREGRLRYVPVLSDALPSDNWTGRTGFVHRVVMEDFADLSGHQVYACGAPIVVDSARAEYSALAKLPPDEFHADSFTTEADKHREAPIG